VLGHDALTLRLRLADAVAAHRTHSFEGGAPRQYRVAAHGSGSSITWNRKISRIVYDKCASCHRPAGAAFSHVGGRRGAVKGFGQFRNDQSLSQEQIELITKWVDGGIRRGNNPGMLPQLVAQLRFAPGPFLPAATTAHAAGGY
jgi:hypothetical protein